MPSAGGDRWFGEMVDDQRQVRVPFGERWHEPQQLLGLGAHVEGEVRARRAVEHFADPPVRQKVGVGIAVHQMADADDRSSAQRSRLRSATTGSRIGTQATTPATGVEAAVASIYLVSSMWSAACTKTTVDTPRLLARRQRRRGRSVGRAVALRPATDSRTRAGSHTWTWLSTTSSACARSGVGPDRECGHGPRRHRCRPLPRRTRRRCA